MWSTYIIKKSSLKKEIIWFGSFWISGRQKRTKNSQKNKKNPVIYLKEEQTIGKPVPYYYIRNLPLPLFICTKHAAHNQNATKKLLYQNDDLVETNNKQKKVYHRKINTKKIKINKETSSRKCVSFSHFFSSVDRVFLLCLCVINFVYQIK